MSSGDLSNRLDKIDRNYVEILTEVIRLRQLIEDNDNLRPEFLENTAENKKFIEKVNEMIDSMTHNTSRNLKIMGYFDNTFIDKLLPCAERVKIIGNDKVKKTKTLKSGLKRLYDLGAEVRTNDELHARMVLTHIGALVGSGDLEADCVGGNRIDACIFSDHPEIKRSSNDFFEKIWNNSEDMFVETVESLFYEDYSKYAIGDPLAGPWNVRLHDGSVTIEKANDSKWRSQKCVKITSPWKTNILYSFGSIQKVSIDYYLKRIDEGEKKFGSPFIVESSDTISQRNNDRRAIYMEIKNGALFRDIGSSTELKLEKVIDLEANKWHHIVLKIDCVNHMYEGRVNQIEITGKIPIEFNSVNAIRTKHSFGKNNGWTTYLGPIKIKKLGYSHNKHII